MNTKYSNGDVVIDDNGIKYIVKDVESVETVCNTMHHYILKQVNTVDDVGITKSINVDVVDKHYTTP